MTREEAVELCAYVEAACPSQQMTDFTPDVWHEIVPPSFTLAECRAAVAASIRRGERWVDLGAIVAEVKRVRADAAEREHIHVLLDPAQYRAEVDAADAAFLAKLAARAGRAPLALKPVPPADYEDGGQ